MAVNILIVDDESHTRKSLERFLEKEYTINTASNGLEGLEILKKIEVDIVMTDIQMPEMNGIDFLKEGIKICPEAIFIIMTAYGTIETAVSSMKLGAKDYVLKPFELHDIKKRIEHFIEYKKLIFTTRYRTKGAQEKYDINNIIGKNKKILNILETVKELSGIPCNILITGETGTGKELIAKAIHFNSNRAQNQFLPVNCAAIPKNLFESEIFGHVKGAFTGAIKDKIGFLKAADNGTIFLDEIGEIPCEFQAKLLRAIETKKFYPVGSSKELSSDIRIISATNCNLEKEIENEKFRSDLYYRLKVVDIHIPSLRERKDDIPILADHFIKKYNIELRQKCPGIEKDALKLLMDYNWPGNIRELENIIERAVIFCKGDIIKKEILPIDTTKTINLKEDFEIKTLKAASEEFEKAYVENVLKRFNGNKEETSKVLDISLSGLYKKV